MRVPEHQYVAAGKRRVRAFLTAPGRPGLVNEGELQLLHGEVRDFRQPLPQIRTVIVPVDPMELAGPVKEQFIGRRSIQSPA